MACRSCRSCLELVSRQSAPIGARTSRHTSQVRRLIPSSSLGSRRSLHGTTALRKSEGQQLQEVIRTGAVKAADGIASYFPKAAVEPHLLYSVTHRIYETVSSQADYTITEEDRRNGTITRLEGGEEVGNGKGVWHDDFQLPATYSTWAQVTMLHLYLIIVRLRCLHRDEYRAWQKHLEDHFFWDAEARMDVKHKVTSSRMRQTYLKDLFTQWRGAILAYDEGLVKGDAVLAAAVWRNIFKRTEDVDVRRLAAVVSWMRMAIKNLDQMPDEALAMHAKDVFKWPPSNELRLVDEPTAGLKALEAEIANGEAAATKPKAGVKSRFA